MRLSKPKLNILKTTQKILNLIGTLHALSCGWREVGITWCWSKTARCRV